MTDYPPYQGGAFQPPPAYSGPARPLHVQAWIAMVTLGLVGAEALVAAGLHAFTYPVLAGISAPTGAQSAVYDFLAVEESRVAVLLLMCAGLAFVVWLYRARTNLDGPDDAELTWRRGWTIGGWFIPLGNVAIPQLVVSEIDRVSERYADQAEGRPHRRHRGVISAWVVLWSISVAINQVGEIMLEAIEPGPAALVTATFGLLNAVAAGSAILLVRQVTANQDRVRQAMLRFGRRVSGVPTYVPGELGLPGPAFPGPAAPGSAIPGAAQPTLPGAPRPAYPGAPAPGSSSAFPGAPVSGSAFPGAPVSGSAFPGAPAPDSPSAPPGPGPVAG